MEDYLFNDLEVFWRALNSEAGILLHQLQISTLQSIKTKLGLPEAKPCYRVKFLGCWLLNIPLRAFWCPRQTVRLAMLFTKMA